ncbi:MAG: hypothetical protein PHO02_06380 [Candidatus Nanoarchaeia archaeon]|nr:hypothetical protein [Candidatus Nanoarchaeia archaeon]
MRCKCGCGIDAGNKPYWPYTPNSYILGHNMRGKTGKKSPLFGRKVGSRLKQKEQEKIVSLYKKGCFINDIKKITKRSYTAIRRILIENDISVKRSYDFYIPHRPDIKDKRIISLYTRGYSRNNIAMRLRCDPKTIENRLKKEGIKLRTDSEQSKIEYASGRFKPWNKGKRTGIVPSTVFKKGLIPHNKGKKMNKFQKAKLIEGRRRFIEKYPERFRRNCIKGGKKGGAQTVRVMAENSPYEYDGKKFLSKSEILCYKFLKRQGIPFEYNFKVGTKYIDFFINHKLFWEHHPLNIRKERKETFEGYYLSRRKALDDAGYSKYLLIVTTKLDFKEVKAKIKDIV